MPLRDVRYFMGKHGSDFAFIFGLDDESTVDTHIAARASKGIDIRARQDKKMKGLTIGFGGFNQAIA